MKVNLRADYIPCDGSSKNINTYYADHVQASEKVRVDINRSNDLIQMLDLSLLCIYFLTGDKLFYEQNREKIINIIAEYNYNN